MAGRARAEPARTPRTTLGERALTAVRSLPDHSLIDRLVRGRAWIPVLGVLLAGLVAMQVEILKLGTSIGRSIERTTSLQSQNELLQAGVAALADDQRIERLAAGMGMAMPSPSSIAFVSANGRNAIGRALANVHAPDPANFAAQLAAQLAAAAAPAPVAAGAATSQPAAGPATPSSSGTAPTYGPGGTTAVSPTVATPASAATGAAPLAPSSAPQSGSPSGG